MQNRHLSTFRQLFSALLLFAATPLAMAQAGAAVRSEEHAFRAVTLAERLEFPWSIAFLPDGRMLVTERVGRLRVLRADGAVEAQPVGGTPRVAAVGQGGLFDVVLHPRFAENGWIYLSYAGEGPGGYGTEVVRGKLVRDARGEQFTGQQLVFRMAPKSGGGRHFGGRMVFDRQGLLYITLGDRGDQDRAQKPDDHAGSVIRLHDDGRVPADNPLLKRAGAKPEKFTLGNRNMQGAALHPQTGELWTHEHGPQGGDEVNVMRAGLNYGWPVITCGANYGTGTRIGEGTAKPGMVQPLHTWVPSIAPSGMAFYTGERFPRWRGDLFVGALAGQVLVRLRFDGERLVGEERLLRGMLGRIRDVRMGPDGLLYLLTDERAGRLVRLEPAS